MPFIDTVPEERATGLLAELYETDRAALGHLPNFARAFSLRPEVYGAWKQLNAAIKAGMDLRTYELVTVAAARRLRSSYCMLAHGTILADKFLAPDDVRALAADGDGAALEPRDRAVMDLAEQVVDDATAISEEDVDGLRSLGLSDEEILGVVLAAAARCFFSKTLDALGAEPDRKFADLDPALRDALTVGRPIAAA
ncbi:MAG TPA: carboxymuconolactone decarboxylase family protein [Solirubrobacteraceae bacterium]|jgi:uncharacterized peroxidase-related enzyme